MLAVEICEDFIFKKKRNWTSGLKEEENLWEYRWWKKIDRKEIYFERKLSILLIFFDTNFFLFKKNGIKTLMNNATVMNITQRLSLIFPRVLLYILMFPDERDLTSFATRWPQMLSQLHRSRKSLFLVPTLESLCPGFVIQRMLLFTLPNKVSLHIIETPCYWEPAK